MKRLKGKYVQHGLAYPIDSIYVTSLSSEQRLASKRPNRPVRNWIDEFVRLCMDFEVDYKRMMEIICRVDSSKKDGDSPLRLYERARNAIL